MRECYATGKNGAREARKMLNQEAINAIYNYALNFKLPGEGLTSMKVSVGKKILELKTDLKMNLG